MLTLKRSASRGIESGRLLPYPFQIFRERQIDFRTGGVQKIAGPPGSMKTILAHNLVNNMRVPTLYFSNDSDEKTTASRILAMLTDTPTRECAELLASDKSMAAEALAEWPHVTWCYKANPDLVRIRMESSAFFEVYGRYPDHIVIDILMNVDYEGAGEQNYWDLMQEFNILAREWDSSITILHHTTESAKAGSPPPRSAIMGKANQLPTVILTLWGDSEQGTLDIAVVKNRFGVQDPEAKNPFRLDADANKNILSEPNDVGILFRDGVGVPENAKINPVDMEDF